VSGFLPAFIEVATASADPTDPTGSADPARATHPARVALVAHGILGSASNWRSFIRKLVDTDALAATFRWLLVDLRHHGSSSASVERPPLPDTVLSCAKDLVALTDSLGVTPTLSLGHSFGGKVVLAHADHLVTTGRTPPRGVWLLDSSLSPEDVSANASRDGASTGDDVARVIAALRTIALPIESREALVTTLRDMGFSLGLSQWMTTNVQGRAGPGYRWRFDLDGIEALISDYFATDAWAMVASVAARARVGVVRGGKSDRVSDSDATRLGTMPGVEVHTLAEAGHWVHVDDPDGLRRLFVRAVADAVADQVEEQVADQIVSV